MFTLILVLFSYFYYCILYSAMVLVSAPVSPRPVYDSDVVYILIFITIGSFIVYENYADQRDIDFVYLGCM